jgi:hypothetical protein
MSDARTTAPRALFLALANDVGMDRLPGALTQLSAVCALISPGGFYCAQTRFIERHFALPRHHGIWLGTAFARRRLATAVRTWDPDIVIPLDDIASNLLRNLALGAPARDRLRTLIETSLGAPVGYAASSTRAELMRAASAAGIRLPRFHIVNDAVETLHVAADWGYPVVLKEEHTCGGTGVFIIHDAAAMHAALMPPLGLGTAWRWGRRAGRNWMWNLTGVTAGRNVAPVMQALIRGVPAMRTAATWKGEVIDGVSFAADHVHPAPTGASSMVHYVEHPEMAEAVRRLVRLLGCSGFMSFDFMLDERRGAAYLIEMNPRPIGTTHLGRLFGHDVVAALLARLQGRPAAAATASTQPDRRIALFPRELERDPLALGRLRSDGVLHDVPYDDPVVVAAYVQRLAQIHPAEADLIARGILSSRVGDTERSTAPLLGGGSREIQMPI